MKKRKIALVVGLLAACFVSPPAAAEPSAEVKKSMDAILRVAAKKDAGDKHRYDDFHKYLDELEKEKNPDAALDAIELFVKSAKIDDGGKTWAFIRAIRICRARGDHARAAAYVDRAVALGRELYAILWDGFDSKLQVANTDETWDWLEKIATKKSVPLHVAAGLMNAYGFQAHRYYLPERARRARAFFEKKGRKPGAYSDRWMSTIRMFDALKTFPRAEAEIVFPVEPAWFGTAKDKTVRVKDLGFNPHDMTAVIQKVIDDPSVGTIVFDKTDAPWRATKLKPRSNQTFVFESGVKFLAPASEQGKPPGDLFFVHNVSNVVFVGRGESPADVRLAMYADYAERRKLCRDYGGSGFTLDGAKNIAICNLTVADCACDGLSLSGLGVINNEIFVKDVVFTSNYRQACSICNVEGVYFKNVAFNDTRGNDPMCGIDIEPSIQECQATFGIYLFDCTFKGNVGSHLNFSCSSIYPVSLYAKRCVFEPNPAGCLEIFPLPSIYFRAKVAAPSKVIFDECRFRQFADKKAINFNHATFFNVALRNSVVEDVGLSGRGGEAWGAPVAFNLGRSFGKPMGDVDKPGKIVFDNLQIKGYKNSPTIRVCDTKGTYSVTNLFGTLVHKGKKVRAQGFRHVAPEANIPNTKPFDPAVYAAPKRLKQLADAKFTAVPMNMSFAAGGPWFEPKPKYAAIYWDGEAWTTRALGDDVDVSDLAGKPVAYMSLNGVACQFGSRKGLDHHDVYFEVPAGGKTCTIRLYNGPCEVRDPSGRIAGAFGWDQPDAPNGAKYVTIKPKSKRAEIWSVRIHKWAHVKFLHPLTGVFAEKPEWLPRLKDPDTTTKKKGRRK